jgi:hypothetical protein
MTPFQVVLKLSWDNERPTNSDFFRKEKEVYWAISGEEDGWGTILMPFAARDSGKEVWCEIGALC